MKQKTLVSFVEHLYTSACGLINLAAVSIYTGYQVLIYES